MKYYSAATIFLLLSATPAAAYIDPGTGGMILQALLASLAVGFVAISTAWGRVKQTILKVMGKSQELDKHIDSDEPGK